MPVDIRPLPDPVNTPPKFPEPATIELPGAELILPDTATREEWLDVRSGGIGASDMSKILEVELAPGVYGDRYSLWLEKTGQAEDWEPHDDHPAHIGNILEPVMLAELARRRGVTIHSPGLFMSKHNPILRFTPDGLYWDEAHAEWVLVEIKANGGWQGIKMWADGDTPLHPLAQVQYAMHASGIKRAVIFALAGGNSFQTREFDYDPELGEELERQATEFWNEYVVPRRTPDPTALSLELLNKSFAVSVESKPLIIDNELGAQLVTEHETKGDAKRSAEAQFDAVNARIKQLAQDADEIYNEDGDLLFTVKNNSTFRERALREEEPELYAQFQKPASVFDKAAFKAAYPEKHRAYCARAVKNKGG